MSDGESFCTQCNQPKDNLDGGICADCRSAELATVPPTPNFSTREPGNIETIVPGTSEPQPRSVDRVGDYDLIEEIARGGMGVVYKANHRNLNRISAVKMILGGRFSSEEERQRFHIEAESAARLDHPSIVPIYEIGDHDGQAFFAMKFVDGGSLSEKIKDFSGKPKDAAKLMIEVAEGVHHAHQRGVLHRDLKPANILLDKEGHPFVTDLGLAKSTSGGSDLTQTGAVLGTPTYMPPEQAAGKSVTTAADVYSLGAILYELIAGKPPYEGSTSVSVVMQVIDGPPPSPRSVNPSVDRNLELIIQKCLHRDPGERYSSAQELANDLGAWRVGDSISVRAPSVSARLRNWVRKNQRLAYSAFAILMGGMVCAPIVFSFFSEDVAQVYSHFPDEEAPIFYRFEFAEWISAASAIFLFLVLWPAIGFLNAAVSRAHSVWSSLVAGISTAAVLALIFYCLVGWLIFLQGAKNTINSQIETLANATWPREGVDAATAKEAANSLYRGLESVEDRYRARIVTARIKADLYASSTKSFGIGLVVVGIFSGPIIFGTVIGFLLLNRSIPVWLVLIRYVVAWWILLCIFVATVFGIGSYFSDSVSFTNRPMISRQLDYAIVVIVLGFFAWLVLRKWTKHVAGDGGNGRGPNIPGRAF